MKKTINIILMLFTTLILSSCLTSRDDVNKAKQELGIIELNKIGNNSGINIDNEIEKAKQYILPNEDVKDNFDGEKKEERLKRIEIKSLTDEQFLEFNSLEKENLLDGEVEITGKTLSYVDKIIVTFANNESDFPVDTYTLKQFVPGADTFLYRAFSRYETLDFGKNIYVFEAYSGSKVTKLQITLNVVKEEEKEISEKVKQVYEDISLNSLPVGASFGTPVDIGNGKISYSDLRGLEIKRDINPNLTCDNLTSVLADKIDSWFFWNTCRSIKKNEGISFFVVRLDRDNYVYEKHYYLSYEGLYGVQELETGTGVNSKNIGEKNTELKEKNEDFTILEVVDELFIEILK